MQFAKVVKLTAFSLALVGCPSTQFRPEAPECRDDLPGATIMGSEWRQMSSDLLGSGQRSSDLLGRGSICGLGGAGCILSD